MIHFASANHQKPQCIQYRRCKDSKIIALKLPRHILEHKSFNNKNKIRWGLSSSHYINAAIRNVEHELSLIGKSLANNVTTLIAHGYRPELDTSPLLNDDQANYYQNLIGVLRWTIELGRIDILIHVSLLSSFLSSPREGHLAQVHHIFAYFKKYPKSTMVFDDTTPNIDSSQIPEAPKRVFHK
jgi:hypothetical protein